MKYADKKMFLLRSAKIEDLDHLYELSKMQNFINLPADKRKIEKKIENSKKSFLSASKKLWENDYFFVLVDKLKNKIIGCSLIHAQHGTPDLPHLFFSINKKHKSSTSLQKEFEHETLLLGYSEDGPSEIGGLILHPDYRKNSHKLGKQISFVRFLFMGIYPEKFKDSIHAELLPPMDKDGKSPLWEAIGKKFTNMDYKKADLLSLANKEFVLNLYPREAIYKTILPADARKVIGQVGEETLPVKNMLENIGFSYTWQVDPFDGGPHYRASLKEIKRVLRFFKGSVKKVEKIEQKNKEKLLISLPCEDGLFAAVSVDANIKNEQGVKKIIVEARYFEKLEIEDNFKTNAIFLTGDKS